MISLTAPLAYKTMGLKATRVCPLIKTLYLEMETKIIVRRITSLQKKIIVWPKALGLIYNRTNLTILSLKMSQLYNRKNL
jgi:hypothetical protein